MTRQREKTTRKDNEKRQRGTRKTAHHRQHLERNRHTILLTFDHISSLHITPIHISNLHQRNGHVTREAKPERRTRVEPCRRPASRHNDSVDGTGVPQLGRGEKNEGVDATVVAGGDLVGDVVKTSSHILRSPASTTQGEIAFDTQHMMSLPRQGRERSIVVVVSSIRAGSSPGERRLETPCGGHKS